MTDEPLNNDEVCVSETTTVSEPSTIPPEAPEAPRNIDTPVSLNNDNPENTPILTENPEESKPVESGSVGVENPKVVEPIPEPMQTPETGTAQIPVNESLPVEPEPIKPEPVSVPQSQPDKISLARSFLAKARNAIQFRKRKKLDKIMSLFLKKQKIINDEVEKFLHVSDATATRYLDILEKENKIRQVGKTGHAVSYTRI